MEASALVFADDGDVPNSRHPLIVYAGALDLAGGDPAAAFEALFAANGWGGGWRNGIFAFHHYHSTAHEVLGIARGEAEVRFGGEKGETVTVRAGDAVLIPAGVGHKRLSATPDLPVIGAYPRGATSCARGRRIARRFAGESPQCRGRSAIRSEGRKGRLAITGLTDLSPPARPCPWRRRRGVSVRP